MKLSWRSVAVLPLSLLSPTCEAVRKQAAKIVPDARPFRVSCFSKSVGIAPGQDGRIHSYTREVRSSRVGEGVDSMAATVIRECKDGLCEERRLLGGEQVEEGEPASSPEWLSEFFNTDGVGDLVADFQGAPRFGLQDLDALDGFGGIHSWEDIDQLLSGSGMVPLVDSVTRTVQLTESDGQRHRSEVITRCTNGECKTEVIHDDSAPVKLEQAAEHASHTDGVDAASRWATSVGQHGVRGGAKATAGEEAVAAAMPDAATGEETPHRRSFIEHIFGDDAVAAERRRQGAAPRVDLTARVPARPSAARPRTLIDLAFGLEETAATGRGIAMNLADGEEEPVAGARATAEHIADAEESAPPRHELRSEYFSGVGHELAGLQQPARKKKRQPAATAAQAADYSGVSGVGHELAGLKSPPARGSPPKDSTVRTTVIKEIDGKWEETVTVERCHDGKCTRDIHHIAQDGERTDAHAEYSKSVEEP